MADNRAYGKSLRKLRLVRGLTQAQLASRIGTSASLIALFESGKREPRLDRSIALAHALALDEPQRREMFKRAGLSRSDAVTESLVASLRSFQGVFFVLLEQAVLGLSRDALLSPAERRL